MISTRVEEGNIIAIDKLARGLGISRSDWIRQAILAELVMELSELKREEPQVSEVAHETFSDAPSDLAPIYGAERQHHLDCIKSVDHEGECLE